MNLIKIDSTGRLIVDNKIVALVTHIEIKGKVIYDSSSVEGTSGKKKVFNGYDDSAITIDVLILEKKANQRFKDLQVIITAFKKIENGEPLIYKIESDLFKACNINQVNFIEHSVVTNKEEDCILITLSFQEHNPVVAIVQEQQTQQNQKQQNSNNNLLLDYEKALITEQEKKSFSRKYY